MKTSESNLHFVPDLIKTYRHRNWGGVWILARTPGRIRVTMHTPPKNWDWMKIIGWKEEMYFDAEDIIYFKEIEQ